MLKANAQGLLPAIAQDARTGQVLMLAYMDAEALRRTIESGQAWFYSRSRAELWHKGATSGHFLQVKSISLDCDSDALLLQVEPTGPACHTGNQSCFFQDLEAKAVEFDTARQDPMSILPELFAIIQERARTQPQGSYVARLLSEGVDRIGKKVIEEAGETVIAAKNGEKGQIAYEMADLWFHCLVLLASLGMTPEEVWEELRKRRK